MTGTMPQPVFMTAAEIAERIIDIHPRTLKRAMLRGEIRGHFHLGKWRFESESVIAWVRRKKGSAESFAAEPESIAKRRRGWPRKGVDKRSNG